MCHKLHIQNAWPCQQVVVHEQLAAAPCYRWQAAADVSSCRLVGLNVMNVAGHMPAQGVAVPRVQRPGGKASWEVGVHSRIGHVFPQATVCKPARLPL